MAQKSASRGITGGNTVACNLRSWKQATGTEGEQFSSKEQERVRGGAAQEGAAGKDGVGKVDMAFVFGIAMGNIRCPGGGLGEIEDQKTGEDLLKDKVGLFGVEMDKPHSVFQAAEGDFNAPASGVKGFEGGEREPLGIKVRDEGLHLAAAGLKPDNTEGYFVKIRAVRL